MTDREAVLGFKPQKESPYNKLLHYADKLDAESNEQLSEIKTQLGRTIQLRDIKIGTSHWTGQLSRYIRLYGLKFSKEDHLNFIHLLYELLLIPDLDYTLIQKFAQLLISLLKKVELLSREDLELPWRPLHKLLKVVTFSYVEKSGLILFPENVERILKTLVFFARNSMMSHPKDSMLKTKKRGPSNFSISKKHRNQDFPSPNLINAQSKQPSQQHHSIPIQKGEKKVKASLREDVEHTAINQWEHDISCVEAKESNVDEALESATVGNSSVHANTTQWSDLAEPLEQYHKYLHGALSYQIQREHVGLMESFDKIAQDSSYVSRMWAETIKHSYIYHSGLLEGSRQAVLGGGLSTGASSNAINAGYSTQWLQLIEDTHRALMKLRCQAQKTNLPPDVHLNATTSEMTYVPAPVEKPFYMDVSHRVDATALSAKLQEIKVTNAANPGEGRKDDGEAQIDQGYASMLPSPCNQIPSSVAQEDAKECDEELLEIDVEGYSDDEPCEPALEANKAIRDKDDNELQAGEDNYGNDFKPRELVFKSFEITERSEMNMGEKLGDPGLNTHENAKEEAKVLTIDKKVKTKGAKVDGYVNVGDYSGDGPNEPISKSNKEVKDKEELDVIVKDSTSVEQSKRNSDDENINRMPSVSEQTTHQSMKENQSDKFKFAVEDSCLNICETPYYHKEMAFKGNAINHDKFSASSRSPVVSMAPVSTNRSPMMSAFPTQSSVIQGMNPIETARCSFSLSKLSSQLPAATSTQRYNGLVPSDPNLNQMFTTVVANATSYPVSGYCQYASNIPHVPTSLETSVASTSPLISEPVPGCQSCSVSAVYSPPADYTSSGIARGYFHTVRPHHPGSRGPYEAPQQSSSRRRLHRGSSLYFNVKSRDVLEMWYQQHLHRPYASDSQATHLASQSGLSKNQVMKWLSNRRYRDRDSTHCGRHCNNTLSAKLRQEGW